jgi:hypothetical protein
VVALRDRGCYIWGPWCRDRRVMGRFRHRIWDLGLLAATGAGAGVAVGSAAFYFVLGYLQTNCSTSG